MTVGQAISTCLRRYAGFTGRATRPQLGWFFLFSTLVLAACLALGGDDGLLPGIALLALLPPSLAIAVRRLHDVGKSGWRVLVGLVPVAGLLLVYWLAQPSGGPNG